MKECFCILWEGHLLNKRFWILYPRFVTVCSLPSTEEITKPGLKHVPVLDLPTNSHINTCRFVKVVASSPATTIK
jgi:hypothetical protein